MFNKKCNKCNSKIKKDFDFCPYCGNPQKDSQKKWGMLGRYDRIERGSPMPEDIFSGGFLNKMIGSAIKMIEREMQKTMQEQETYPNTNFKLFINGRQVNPKNIKIRKVPIEKKASLIKEQKSKEKNMQKIFDEKQKKQYSKLKKKIPETNIRRLANTIIYELEVPEVKSIKDVSIIKRSKTIEIKAIGKNIAYFKVLEVDYPIVNYNLKNKILILELAIKE